MAKDFNYDVIVIGGGHAGCEAAHASARIGAKTCLITHSISTIGLMSCNPAFGGVGKGHLVREIDALDGLMGRIADDSAIQYRELNKSRGAAVRGPRVQADRDLYKYSMQEVMLHEDNIFIYESSVIDLLYSNKSVNGVVLKDFSEIYSKTVVLTTGTFLGGIIHRGNHITKGGRIGEKAETGLSKSLKEKGFNVSRLKTGTPPRIFKDSINWDILDKQYGDKNPKFMSFATKSVKNPQVPCFITRTNDETHQIISDNIQLSSIYNGNIESTGPRYCPSIEDKVSRFSDKNSHQIFLEPEGLESNLIYPNGISTSMPSEIQNKFLKTIKGLENCKVYQDGYAIEYDFMDPIQLFPTLETKILSNLYFAGQINGTTGYEEAGAQGLIAGANAALKTCSLDEFVIDRSQGYIGVLIDDLITNGVSEPYRMFTSRSEYRLSLRTDNADQRLTNIGLKYSLISSDRRNEWEKKSLLLSKIHKFNRDKIISPSKLKLHGIDVKQDGKYRTLSDILSLPDISISKVLEVWPELVNYPKDILEQMEISSKYAGYLDRQKIEIERFKKDENLMIPSNILYNDVGGISNEMREKLEIFKPRTLGAASRIKGITPGCLTALLSYVKYHSHNPL